MRGVSEVLSCVCCLLFVVLLLVFALLQLQGAATTIYCALTPGLESGALLLTSAAETLLFCCSCSGHYFSDCRDTQPSTLAQNDTLAAELWAVSERMCKITAMEQRVCGGELVRHAYGDDQKKTE